MKVEPGVTQMADADEAAEPTDFAEWVAARGPSLQRFAYLVTRSADDAPDLVQEALARAYPRWADLARRGTADAYVRRSIVNGNISGWRKRRRLVSVAEPEEYVASAPSTDAAHDDADAAWQLCAELPARQRAAVVLRFYEDLSFAQIAVILDCPEATARSYVHRAVRTLRERLSESEPLR